MKNIHELLTEIGLTVPEDQKAAFDKALLENYRTKSDYDKAVAKRDEYKAALDAKPTSNPEDTAKLSNLETQLAALKDQLADASRDKAAREALAGKKFVNEITRNAVYQAIVSKLKEDKDADPAEVLKGLTTDKDGKELPNVFVSDAEQKKARFTAPKKPEGSSTMTKEQIMSIKDRSERRAAIADNMNLFTGGDN